MRFFSKKSVDQDIESSSKDFLGNPAISPQTAEAFPTEIPRYRYPYIPLGQSMRLVGLLTILVFVLVVLGIISLLREQRKQPDRPLVFMQNQVGKLLPVEVFPGQTNLGMVEAFLDYYVANALSMSEGAFPGHKRIYPVGDDKVLKEMTKELMAESNRLRQDKVTITAKINRVDASSPERFVINHKLKMVAGSAYGVVISTIGNSGGKTRECRWDFELQIVPRTATNVWGLHVSQLRNRYVDDEPLRIPESLRRPEDLLNSQQ